MLKFVLPTLAATLFAAASAQQPVTVTFNGMVGDAPIACGQDYPNIGSEGTTIAFQDARMYVSNLRLINAAGQEVPISLEQDGLWQYENVALLDFENATGGCSDVGTKATNNQVKGTVPEGNYDGLVFDLGVPFELNHADATTAPSPLNVSSLFWSWQYGYKFARIEILKAQVAGSNAQDETVNVSKGNQASAKALGHAGEMDMGDGAANGFWPIHLGSTGCTSPAPVVSPTAECARPNLSTVRLESFNPTSDTVTLDVARLLEGVDVGKSLELAPPGCMSGFDDPDCPTLFKNLGLALETGKATASQTLFRVTGGGARTSR